MSNPAAQVGLFLPTTNIWDVSAVYAIEDISPQLQELLVRLYQNLNSMSVAINLKDTGYYPTRPFVCGKLYFPQPLNNSSTTSVATYRQVQRQTINFGTLPNTGIKSVPHNIPWSSMTTIVEIFGGATDPIGLTGISLDYASPTLANNIEVYCDSVNVNVITGSDRTNYTISTIVIEYLQS